MKSIRSAFLWSLGGIYFFGLFFIVASALLFFNPRTIYPAVRILTRLQLLVMGLRLKIHGYQNFDPRRSYLIMGNHESLFDLFAIPAAMPMRFVAIEAAYHFSLPLWGYLIKKWGNIPILRHDLSKAIASLDQAASVLQSGISIVLLPEGHRTLTGKIGEFKKGPFHLALATRADILPFALSGLFEYCSKQGWHLIPQTARVIFGEPIPYDTFKDDPIEEIQRKVRERIIILKQMSDRL